MVQVGPKSLAQDTAKTVLGGTLGSLRFGSRLHSRPQRSSSCRAAHGMAAIGCYSAGGGPRQEAAMYDGPGVRILSNSMRSDRRTCIHSVMQDANKNEETLSVRDESVCGQKHDRGN
jgi:hypothetical protein